ncbi:MAG: saccharopine dehydrogenase [Deltaproteobacteria bacterium]|nr:MAG: saccharopine dehydrogenase [Deltaproteobacteria bacterium]
MSSRDFDLILWGATGFAGRLVAEVLAEHPDLPLGRWAIAGRSQAKLDAVRDHLAGRVDTDRLPETVLADVDDPPSLQRMAERTRVIATTVGPYARMGSELVAACVAAGTDYADLTGETPWIRRMIDAHHDEATARGVRIVHCCGFDSIPSDLGTLALQQAAITRDGRPFPDVRLAVMKASGGFSGGTIASLLGVLDEARSDRSVRDLLADPHGLDPADARGTGRGRDAFRPIADDIIDGWAAPFLMAPINTRIVRRSNALLGHPWGADFRYREVMRFPPGAIGASGAWAYTLAFGAFMKALQGKTSRRLIERTLLPAPGEGPAPDRIENGHFHVRIIGTGPGRTPLHADVRGGRDPGYGATATMLAESALALHVTRGVAPDPPGDDGLTTRLTGGVLTPASALGNVLIDRLARTEVTVRT